MCCFQGADHTTVSFNNFVIQEDTRDLLQFTVGAATIVSNKTTGTRRATSKHITNINRVITRCKVDSSIHLWVKEPHVILVYLINLDLDNASTTNLVTDDCVRYTNIPVIVQFDNLICIRHTFTCQVRPTILIIDLDEVTKSKVDDTVFYTSKISRFFSINILRCKEFGPVTLNVCSTRRDLISQKIICGSIVLLSGLSRSIYTIIETIIQTFSCLDAEGINNIVTRLFISPTCKRLLKLRVCSRVNKLLYLTIVNTQQFNEVFIG